MKNKLIRLTESDLHNIIKHAVNEVLSHTIQLQHINGTFFPVDSISRKILETELNVDRIPERKFDIVSPILVRKGYKIAISDYN